MTRSLPVAFPLRVAGVPRKFITRLYACPLVGARSAEQFIRCLNRFRPYRSSCRRAVRRALVVKLGDGSEFRNGREATAYLGLVPRQYSTGGKPKLTMTTPLGTGDARYRLGGAAGSVIPSILACSGACRWKRQAGSTPRSTETRTTN